MQHGASGTLPPQAAYMLLPQLCPPSHMPFATQVHVAGAAEYAGNRDFAITVRDCAFEDNTLNVTGAVAAQDSLSVGLKLLGTGEAAAVASTALWALYHLTCTSRGRSGTSAQARLLVHSSPAVRPPLPATLPSSQWSRTTA